MAYEIITQRFVPSSGGTVSILDSQGIVNQSTIEPIATLGTLTINFPTNVFDGQIVSLFFVKGVTSLTLSAGSGRTFNNTISTIIDGGYISFVYNQALSTYYSNGSLFLSTTQLSGTITNTQLAGSITASKLVGTDITTIGTLVAGAVPTTLLSGTITNAQLAGSIAYSKLSLTNSVVSGDIVSLVWSKVTSTPTTLSGYGITDATSTTLADGKINIGNVSNVATAVTLSGDVTVTNAGVTAIGASKITNTMLAGSIDLTTKVTGILPPSNGGTGINNNEASTITISGSFATTLTITNTTSLTLPTSGTVYSSKAASITSASLLAAMSDATGTGASVFATSPTFITPILGTPTSGTLTNCTFPTLNQNTTGSAASLSISGQTGLLTFTGLASTNRIKTIRDAADTILELGGSYTPTGTWTSLPLTSPKVTTGIQDANGNQMFAFTPTASSVDYFTFINAATANPATIKMQATGSDSNVNMLLSPKGTGRFQISDGTDLTKILSFNLSGATTAVTGIWLWSPTTAKTLTFPDVTSTVAALAQIQTFTAAQTFSASFTISAIGASTLAVGTTSSVYRTTNAGSNIAAFGIFDIDSGIVAGNKAVIFDTANYITLTHANGTRRMAGASIQLGSLNNTAGSEAADLLFLTSTAGAAITEAGRFTGAGAFQQIGKTTKYNNISTVSNGVPSIYATSDLTGQTAAIAATTLYTPTSTGMFRISIYEQVTTAATTSSILGGATGTVITYTDGDGSVAQSITVAMDSTTGTVVTTAAGNTTTTNLIGVIVINAKTGVAIQFAIGYTSVGATPMQFSAHLKCEAL